MAVRISNMYKSRQILNVKKMTHFFIFILKMKKIIFHRDSCSKTAANMFLDMIRRENAGRDSDVKTNGWLCHLVHIIMNRTLIMAVNVPIPSMEKVVIEHKVWN